MKGEAPEQGERHDCCPNLTINLDEHRLVPLNRRRCVEFAIRRSRAIPCISPDIDAFYAKHRNYTDRGY